MNLKAMALILLSYTLMALTVPKIVEAKSQCYDLFKYGKAIKLDKKKSAYFNDIFHNNNAKDTTSQRAVSKNTLSKSQFTEIFNQLISKYKAKNPQFELIERDKKTEGFRNITATAFSSRYKIKFGNTRVTAKIRIRKYGLIDNEAEVNIKNFVAIDSMKNISSLEFKSKDPTFQEPGFVVELKEIIKFYDNDLQKLWEKNLTKEQFKQIIDRNFQLNRSLSKLSDNSLNEMIKLMAKTYRSVKFKPVNLVVYERTSYKFNAPKDSLGNTSEIQMTIDENIDVIDLNTNKSAPIYKNTPIPIVVVEVKIPLDVLEFVLNPELSHDPDFYKNLAQFLEQLNYLQLKGFEIEKGKLNQGRKSL